MHCVAPAADEVPVGQSVHVADPAMAANWPAGQAMHAIPEIDVEPLSQFVQAFAPGSDVVPAAQSTQVVAPPMAANVFAAHIVQLVAAVSEYVPAEQSVHAAAPTPEYVPAAQASHWPAFA